MVSQGMSNDPGGPRLLCADGARQGAARKDGIAEFSLPFSRLFDRGGLDRLALA
jgi:hypothetical protein